MSHLVVWAVPVAVLLVSGGLMRDQIAQTREDAEHQAAWAARYAAAEVRRSESPGTLGALTVPLSATLREIRAETLAGYMITDADGTVVAASGDNLGRDLSADPIVEQALQGSGTVASVRPKDSPNRTVALGSESRRATVRVFVAAPIRVDGEVLGAVVVSRTPREELQALYHILPGGLLPTLLLSIATAVLLALWAGWGFSRSLRRMSLTARAVAAGTEGPAALAGTEPSRIREVADLTTSVSTMAKRLDARLAYISEFASNVSHEFKTPLTTLRGTLELLADDDEMPPAQRQRFLDNATAEVDRMEAVVSGLLALARAEEGSRREHVPLHVLLRGLDENVEEDLQPVVLYGDGEQLRLAVANLVDNALQHGAAPVGLRTWREGAHAIVEVHDAGGGISTANQPRVFDRFFTTDRVEGTGLGLALVRTIAEAHGGGVSLVSHPGDTRVRLTLPCEHPPEA